MDNEVYLNTSDVVSLPEVEDVIHQLTCAICGLDSGIHSNSCTKGHAICDSCSKLVDVSKDKCSVKVYDEAGLESVCGANLFGIDDAIRNTSYYKFFMSESLFSCTAAMLGCDAKLKGDAIEEHELNECKFRFCMEGCNARFQGVQSHIVHLVEKHNVPVSHEGGGRFLFRYDRQKYLGSEPQIVPLVRAIICERSKSITLLMGKDLDNYTTRIWVTWCGRLKEDEVLNADLGVCPQFSQGSPGETEISIFEKTIPIIPFVDSVVQHDELDEKFFFDVDNNLLDKFKEEKGGKKYFNLSVKIRKIRINDEVGEEVIEVQEEEINGYDKQDVDEESDANGEETGTDFKDLRHYLWTLATDSRDNEPELDFEGDETRFEDAALLDIAEQKQEDDEVEVEPICDENHDVDEPFNFYYPLELDKFTISYIDDDDLEELHLRQDEYIDARDLAYEEYEQDQLNKHLQNDIN